MKWLVLVAALSLAACKKGDDKVTSGSSTPGKPGVYTSCKYIKQVKSYVFQVVIINEATITQSATYYETSSCSGDKLFDETYVYNYAKSGSNFMLTFESAVLTPFRSDYVNLFNNINFCGTTSWQSGRPSNILGHYCEDIYYTKGEAHRAKITSSGSKLTIVSDAIKYTYTSINGLNFFNGNTTLADGGYIYQHGNMAMFLTISGNDYQSTIYNVSTKRKLTEVGTLNVGTNEVDVTVTSYSQSCPDYDPYIGETTTSKFSKTAHTLATSDESVTIFQKAWFTQSDFESAFLSGGGSDGCP